MTLREPTDRNAPAGRTGARRSVTLGQHAHEAIRNEIVSGRFRPGARLIERELCTLVGASRTAVREALRRLSAEGLILIEPNKGPTVASISADDVRDIFQVRHALEGLACEMFARKATAAEVDVLHATYQEIESAEAERDHQRFVDATNRFYDTILEGAGNTVVQEIINSLKARLTYLRMMALSLPGRGQQSIVSTRQIVEAMRTGDPEAARAAIAHHLTLVEHNTMEAVAYLDANA